MPTAFDRALVHYLLTETVEQLAARLGMGEEDIRIRAQGVKDADEAAQRRQAFTGSLPFPPPEAHHARAPSRPVRRSPRRPGER